MISDEFPTEFRIKARTWQIRYLPKEHASLRDGDGPEDWLLGSCEAHTKTITICQDQSAESMRDTLVHELIHAHYSTLGGVDHEDEESEESFVLHATEAFFEIVGNSKSPWWWPE